MADENLLSQQEADLATGGLGTNAMETATAP